MTNGSGLLKLTSIGTCLAGAAVLAAALAGGEALAQSADCVRLQQAIAAASRGGPGAQLQASVERQRAELSRTVAYARSLGCENHKFLFFGSNPPPQCGEINGQISRMRANLADLQARAGGAGGRAQLVARFNAECAAPAGPGNIFEALFGAGRPAPVQMEPMNPDDASPQGDQPEDRSGINAHAGSYAVCVRTCDGSFFPVSYSGAGSRADSLEEVCRALCPNTDVALYSFPFGGTINQAVSASTGEPYVNMPNALKFTQSYDASCSCRRKGQSWADALAGAEARYGHESRDILVTPEKSAEMSRPILDPKSKAAGAKMTKASAKSTAQTVDTPAPGLDANGADTQLSAEAATISRETTGIARGDAQNGATVRPEPGSDRGGEGSGRGHAEGADSRANALARPINGSSAASSGPAARPVNARRNGWNNARPLRPVSALSSLVHAPQVV